MVFQSSGDGLVPGDVNAAVDVFVRDRLLRTTAVVSADPLGVPASRGGLRSAISSDGRHITFTSGSEELVTNDGNVEPDDFRARLDVTVGAPEAPPLTEGAALLAVQHQPDGRVTLTISLEASSGVMLAVYDVAGRQVVGIHEGRLDAGRHTFTWAGETHGGRPVPTGVYFAHMAIESREGSQRATAKILRWTGERP